MLADQDELDLPVDEQLARQRRRGRDLKSQLELAQSKMKALEVRPYVPRRVFNRCDSRLTVRTVATATTGVAKRARGGADEGTR